MLVTKTMCFTEHFKKNSNVCVDVRTFHCQEGRDLLFQVPRKWDIQHHWSMFTNVCNNVCIT